MNSETLLVRPRPRRAWLHWSRLPALAGVCFLSVNLAAQNSDLPYDSGSSGTDGDLVIPRLPGLEAGGAAYDSARDEIVFFGGRIQGDQELDETWVYDGTEWQLRQPANAPAPRRHFQMVYDANQQVVLLFGGTDGDTYFNDTWSWDGNNWTELSPGTSPGARSHFDMAYTSHNNQVFLFGGWNGEETFNDSWVWDGSTWSQLTPGDNPPARRQHAIAYDSTRQEVVLFGGYVQSTDTRLDDTWVWNGSNWNEAAPSDKPNTRREHRMVYDPNNLRIVLYGGRTSGNNNNYSDTWLWDGNNWSNANSNVGERNDYGLVYHSGEQLVYMMAGHGNNHVSQTATWDGSSWTVVFDSAYSYDMSEQSDGIWNYTTVYIPFGVEVVPVPNAANTPLVWLATGDVRIDGRLNADGKDAGGNNNPGGEAQGGPGGFAGGLGGTRFDISGSYAGQPGSGPGGGLPGVGSDDDGQEGRYNGVYGNAFIQPLIGGSGGGGGASDDTNNGGNGGGGGGAVLIASSRDIIVNGSVTASGGQQDFTSGGNGGKGSGGAIRLVADRVIGSGNLEARDGRNGNSGESRGRIRVEGYFRTLAPNAEPTATASAPTQRIDLDNAPQLLITQVAGESVNQPPTGSLTNPDVVFSQAGDVTITVTGQNVPDGTPVKLRIVSSGEVINLPADGQPSATLSGGSVSFTTTVPAGLGNIQAFAEFTLQN